MRQLSNTIQEALKSEHLEVADLVTITLPEFSYINSLGNLQTLEEVNLYLSGRDLVIDGRIYVGHLREIGEIRYTLSAAPDGGSISIQNLTRSYNDIISSSRKLDGARITIQRAFNTSIGWEIDTILSGGYLRDIKINQEAITLSVISEMARKTSTVAGRPVTQRCYWVFNRGGRPKKPGEIGYECGWTLDQPGDPIVCDKGENTAKGCLSHGNITQFGAVPPFAIMEGTNGYPVNSGTGGGGGSFGGIVDDFCVAPETNIYCMLDDGTKYIKKAGNLEKGDTVIAVDSFGNLYPSSLLDAPKGRTTRLYTIQTESCSLTCSPSHPIITQNGDSIGTRASNLEEGEYVLTYSTNDIVAKQEKIISIEHVDADSEVIILQLDSFHRFLSSNDKNSFIVSHNLKYMPNRANRELLRDSSEYNIQ